MLLQDVSVTLIVDKMPEGVSRVVCSVCGTVDSNYKRDGDIPVATLCTLPEPRAISGYTGLVLCLVSEDINYYIRSKSGGILKPGYVSII